MPSKPAEKTAADTDTSQNPEIQETAPAMPECAKKSRILKYLRALVATTLLCVAPGCINPEKPKKPVSADSTATLPKHPEIDKNKILIPTSTDPRYEKFKDIYVWHPEYIGDLKYIVIYFHGFDREESWGKKIIRFIKRKGPAPPRWTLKDYWERQELESQFRISGLPALFIVPTSARDGSEPKVIDIKNFLEYIQLKTGINTADKYIILIAHSGGGSTVPHWLDDPRVKVVVMSDALYGTESHFRRMVKEKLDSQLIMISTPATRGKHAALLDPLGALNLEKLPKLATNNPQNTCSSDAGQCQENPQDKAFFEACRAKAIHWKGPWDHTGGNGIVYKKEAFPQVLRYIGQCP